jgi:hypothetical protein
VKAIDPHNHRSLRRQLATQKALNWDLETDIKWSLGFKDDGMLLPLDEMAIAFPGASAEQRIALSQLMGLVVNSTIAEMEDALPRLKYYGWENILNSYPANPELWDLGEAFFAEEEKHARAFNRYLSVFAEKQGIDRQELDSILPKAFGSFFQKAIIWDAKLGGHAFWWVVTSVEEVSIGIFHEIAKQKDKIDPLYLDLHTKHLEEEARHANYAHLMLAVIRDREKTLGRRALQKVDFLFSQIVSAPWVISELQKVCAGIRRLRHESPFFEVLHSALPLLEQLPKREILSRLFFAAPYISWLLNPNLRRSHRKLVAEHGAWTGPSWGNQQKNDNAAQEPGVPRSTDSLAG